MLAFKEKNNPMGNPCEQDHLLHHVQCHATGPSGGFSCLAALLPAGLRGSKGLAGQGSVSQVN